MVEGTAYGTDNRVRPGAELLTATGAPALLKRVSWGAIFAGAFIALGVMILLGMMGSAIGFNAIEPQQREPFEGIGVGAGIWWICTSIIALGIGGFVAARLSGIPDRTAATAHGATVWGLVTVFTLWMATSTLGMLLNPATGALAGTMRVATTVASAAGEAATAPGSPVNPSAEEIRNAAEEVLAEARQRARAVDTPALRQDAERISANALDAISGVAWYAFFSSLLSLGAAVAAAGAGAPRHTFLAAREEMR